MYRNKLKVVSITTESKIVKWTTIYTVVLQSYNLLSPFLIFPKTPKRNSFDSYIKR